jgi:hypothetical protein
MTKFCQPPHECGGIEVPTMPYMNAGVLKGS